MKTILLSFNPKWYDELETGKMKFEYRRMLPKDETIVYFYVSRPRQEITGIAHFGKRESLHEWKERFSERSAEVKERIDDYLSDCNYAAPIIWFQRTNGIPLSLLETAIPGFSPPRMYCNINDSPLLEYLEKYIKPIGNCIQFDFSEIKDDDICK